MAAFASLRPGLLGQETQPLAIGMCLWPWQAGQTVQLLIIHNSQTDAFHLNFNTIQISQENRRASLPFNECYVSGLFDFDIDRMWRDQN